MPTEYTVEQGSVSSEISGDTQNFHIGSDQAILNFPTFDIAPSETVAFHFATANPSLSSVLNRVSGGQLSTLAGVLLSNGRVFLINPAGIHITGTARIETAGFIASTLNISNEDFLNRNYRFTRDPSQPPGSVFCEGTVLAKPGDIVALLGGSVRNTGYIVAQTGTVALAAGNEITLSFDGNNWLAVAVTDPLTEVARDSDGKLVTSAIEQSGGISAPGGQVLIQARAVEGLFNKLVSLPAGIVEAVSVMLHNGRIELLGEGGTVAVGGTLAANAGEGLKAGEVTVTGEDVVLETGSKVEARATGENGEGGSVRITSPHPKESGSLVFQGGAEINVDGGSVSGNAGSIELSAAGVDYSGKAAGTAAPGYQGGKLLVDPLFVVFNNTVRPPPPNNADGTPDVAFGDAPAAGTTFVYIASIVGFSEAFFQAVNDITVNRDILMDSGNSLRLESGRDTFLNANVQTQGAGKVTMTADADFSGSGGAASDGVGSIFLAAGKSIQSDAGDVNLSAGGDLIMADTSSMTTGSGNVTLHSGGKTELRKITSTSGNVQSTAGTDWTAFSDVTTGGAGTISTQTGGLLVVKESLTTGSGAVNLTSGDRLDVIRVASTSGDIAMDSGADIIVRDSAVTGGAGKVSLKADDTVTLDGFFEALVRANGTGTLNVEAGRDGTGQVQMDALTQLVTGSGDLTVTAPGPVALQRIISASGNIHVTGGDIVSAHNSITTAGAGSITLEADDALTVDGATTLIRANGTGGVTLSGGVDGTGELTANDGTTVQTVSGPLSLNSAGDMILDKLISSSGGITIDSGKAVTLNDTVVTGGAGKVSVTAGDGVLNVASTGSVRSAAGEIGLTSTGLMTLSNQLLTTGGNVVINSNNGITLDTASSDVTTAGGIFTANADADGDLNGLFAQTHAGSTINTSGGGLSISGGKVDLDGAVRSGAGLMALTSTGGLMTVSNVLEAIGADVTLNSVTGITLDGPAVITTSGGKFTANADSDGNQTGTFAQLDPLSVVSTSGGQVSISGDKVDLDGAVHSGAGLMGLTSTGGLMTVAGTLETTGADMTLNSANGITLDGPTVITTGGAKFTANADSDGNLTGDFKQSDVLSSVNTAGGEMLVSGAKMDLDGILRSGAGKLGLTSTSGLMTVAGTLETAAADMTLNSANGITLDGPTDIRTGGGKFTADADSDGNHTGTFAQLDPLSLINTAGGEVAISGDKIDLDGTVRSGAGKMGLTSTGGLLSVSNTLETAAADMTLNSANGIALDGPADIRTGGGLFTADADSDANGTGDFNQSDIASSINTGAGALSISGKGVNTDGTLKTTTGGVTMTASGAMTVSNKITTEGGNVLLLAVNGISLDHADADVSTLGGEFSADANTDHNNTGSFLQTDAGSVINTSGGTLAVVGRDMDLKGSLRSGAGEISLTAERGGVTASNLLETTGGAIAITAANGISLPGATVRTNGGEFLGNANSDLDADGDFSQTGAASLINTAGGLQLILGRSIGLEGTLRSGTSDIIARASFGGVTASGDLLTTGGAVSLEAANGITLNGNSVRTEGGALFARANTNGDVNGDFVQTAGGVVNTGAGEILINGHRVDTDGSFDTAGAAGIELTATGGYAHLSGPLTTQGGSVVINAADDVELDTSAADILTNGGSVTINANTDLDTDGEFDTASGSLIQTDGGELSITADDFNMSGDLRNTGGTTSLLASRAGTEVYLGNVVRVNGQINISDGEADRVIADTLVIGGDTAGGITAGDFSPATVNTLVLRTGAGVVEEGPGDALADVVAPNLGIRSVSGVNLDIDVANLAIQNDGFGAIHVEDMAGGMAVGTVAGITGVNTLGGGVTLLTYSPFSVNSPVSDLGGGNITLAALGSSAGDDLTLNANVSASGGNGNILLVAGDTLTLAPDVAVSAAGTGKVSAVSGEDFTDGVLDQDGNPAGDLVMGLGSKIQSEDGNLLADAAHDLFLAVLNADSDGDKVIGDVTTYSRYGKTLDVNGDALNITAKNLLTFSYDDFGTKNDPIEINKGAKLEKDKNAPFLSYPSLPILNPKRHIKQLK